MKSILFVIAILITLTAFAQAPQCLGKASSTGSRCKNKTNNANGYCYVHQAQADGQTTKPNITTTTYGNASPSQPNQNPAPAFSIADEIKKLKALLDEGIITQQEFDNEKKKLLSK